MISDQCTGCALCLPPCPVECIDMVPLKITIGNWKWPLPAADVQPHRTHGGRLAMYYPSQKTVSQALYIPRGLHLPENKAQSTTTATVKTALPGSWFCLFSSISARPRRYW